MKIKKFLSLFFLILISSCKDPADEYFRQITKNGFIPFKQPLGQVSTGTIIRGKPSQIFPVAPPTSCFPNTWHDGAGPLRWQSDMTLAETHYSAQFDFNANFTAIFALGAPTIQFKLNMQKIHKVDFEAKGATVEMIDQIALRNYYLQGMSESCSELLRKYPFILNTLLVKEMTFTFLDVFGGRIQIDINNLEQIVDLGVDIKWHIENGYKLIVTSPKYIGYHLAQLKEEDNGFVNMVSHKIDLKNDLFLWFNLNGEPLP